MYVDKYIYNFGLRSSRYIHLPLINNGVAVVGPRVQMAANDNTAHLGLTGLTTFFRKA